MLFPIRVNRGYKNLIVVVVSALVTIARTKINRVVNILSAFGFNPFAE